MEEQEIEQPKKQFTEKQLANMQRFKERSENWERGLTDLMPFGPS